MSVVHDREEDGKKSRVLSALSSDLPASNCKDIDGLVRLKKDS